MRERIKSGEIRTADNTSAMDFTDRRRDGRFCRTEVSGGFSLKIWGMCEKMLAFFQYLCYTTIMTAITSLNGKNIDL